MPARRPGVVACLAGERAGERFAGGIALPVEEQRAADGEPPVDRPEAERVQPAQDQQGALVDEERIAARLDDEIAVQRAAVDADRARESCVAKRCSGPSRCSSASVVAILVTDAGCTARSAASVGEHGAVLRDDEHALAGADDLARERLVAAARRAPAAASPSTTASATTRDHARPSCASKPARSVKCTSSTTKPVRAEARERRAFDARPGRPVGGMPKSSPS